MGETAKRKVPEQRTKTVRPDVGLPKDPTILDMASVTDAEYDCMRHLLLVPTDEDLEEKKRKPDQGLWDGVWILAKLDSKAAVDKPSKE